MPKAEVMPIPIPMQKAELFPMPMPMPMIRARRSSVPLLIWRVTNKQEGETNGVANFACRRSCSRSKRAMDKCEMAVYD